MSEGSFYITTAIDYVNGSPHLGHAYEKITTDVIARWRRLRGDQVRFLTGTDEHGIKVERTARDAGLTPKDYVDQLAPSFQRAWDQLDISYDRFIRTTDPDHARSVVLLLERIRDNGYLREGSYEGWYCEGCEAFKTEKDFVDGRCPEHPNRAPRWLEESNLFFELSRFTQPLLEHIAANPSFIEPEFRRNEVLGLLREGLEDISISRSDESVSWGIPIPFREGTVIYVWFDALINYLTGAGFGSDAALFEELWPADLHIIGKDIGRFHCIIWPAMLLAAGLPLPHQVFLHGWVLTSGEKMSKSTGVSIDPEEMASTWGADPLRYFLTSEVSFGRDGEFSWKRFEEVYNAHLANGLGNLLSRATGMALKYFDSVPDPKGRRDSLLSEVCEKATGEAAQCYDRLELHRATAAAWRIISSCNEQIQHREPWKMAKNPDQRGDLAEFLYAVLESLRIAMILLSPVIPNKAGECLKAMGCEQAQSFAADCRWGGLKAGAPLQKPAPLFPRIEAKAPAS
ncbi:MAG: methionine--tRNA ligase [Rickettsiales bacterium]|nr:methionine--tRNA ligase [Rickettsiales bacterium]